jgi:hypothetical protein
MIHSPLPKRSNISRPPSYLLQYPDEDVYGGYRRYLIADSSRISARAALQGRWLYVCEPYVHNSVFSFFSVCARMEAAGLCKWMDGCLVELATFGREANSGAARIGWVTTRAWYYH